MTAVGWDQTVVLDMDDLDEYSWHKGFFGINETEARRNFTELKTRDLSLFALGNIKNKDVLDIGCGWGMYALTLYKIGANSVSGVDINAKDITDAKRMLVEHGFNSDGIKHGGCTDMPFPDNSFDLIYSGDVVEHITREQKEKCFAEAYRVLRPGGIIVIKTPNLSYLRMTVTFSRIKGLLEGKNPFNIHIAHTRNNPDNEHHGLSTHKELIEIFEQSPFHEVDVIRSGIERKGFPKWASRMLRRFNLFNDTIIVRTRKSIFLGVYP